MPVEAGIDFARVEVRQDALREEVRNAGSLTIVPVADMLDAKANFHRQLWVDLDFVVNVEGECLVGEVLEWGAVALRIVAEISQKKGGRCVVCSDDAGVGPCRRATFADAGKVVRTVFPVE